MAAQNKNTGSLALDLRWLGVDAGFQKIKSALKELVKGQTMQVEIHSYIWPEIEDLIREEDLIVTKREHQKMNTQMVVSIIRKAGDSDGK